MKRLVAVLLVFTLAFSILPLDLIHPAMAALAETLDNAEMMTTVSPQRKSDNWTYYLRQYRTIRWQRRRCLFRHLLLADFSIYLQ